MNPFDDHSGEMPWMPRIDEQRLDDQRIEAILAGTAGAEHAALSAFVADVRDLASGPAPAPSASLATLFTHGFSTENGDLSATAASNVNGPAPQAAGLPKWRKHMMDIKKYVAGLSIAGKLALGAGMAAAAGGGAGTVGVLPDAVQHEFAQVFDPISPFDIPDPESAEAVPDETNERGTGDLPAPPATAPDDSVTETLDPKPTVATPAVTTVPPATSSPSTVAPIVSTTVSAASTTSPASVPVSSTVLPVPSTTAPVPAPAPGGVASLSLTCQQNAGWTGVVCRWSMPDVAGELEVYLLKTGPDANPSERIWGDDPTSYVDVHADGSNTYTYQIEVRTAGALVVGRSGTVSVTMVPVSTDSPSSSTVPPVPNTTVVPEPAPAGVASLSLSCQQNAGWTGVICQWSMPSTGGGLEVYLLKTGPGANPSERIWGDGPTSYVDVHADGTNTYTYQIEVRAAGGSVVGRSGTVTVTMVPV